MLKEYRVVTEVDFIKAYTTELTLSEAYAHCERNANGACFKQWIEYRRADGVWVPREQKDMLSPILTWSQAYILLTKCLDFTEEWWDHNGIRYLCNPKEGELYPAFPIPHEKDYTVREFCETLIAIHRAPFNCSGYKQAKQKYNLEISLLLNHPPAAIVREALRLSGITIQEVMKELNWKGSRPAFMIAINRDQLKQPEKLAKICGLPITDIWPRYICDDEPY